jgi:hypothetical protein
MTANPFFLVIIEDETFQLHAKGGESSISSFRTATYWAII